MMDENYLDKYKERREQREQKKEKELKLTDLIEVSMLQQIQDSFSNMTGLAALTTDKNGTPVTKGSNFSDFCTNHIRTSKKGSQRCEACDKKGAERTLETGRFCTYNCHAGLVDFAAPIMAGGKMVGSFIGGQVLSQKPDIEKFRKIAKDLGVDEDGLVEAVQNVTIRSKERIDSAADFLFVTANILSNIAYTNYKLHLSNIEIEESSQRKSDFLANMSHEIRTPMNAVLGMAEIALKEEMSPTARDCLHQIKASGKALVAIINDILDFSKIESGKMEIIEAEYEPLSVFNDVVNIVMARTHSKKIAFTMDIPQDIPYKLFGDNIRISQILTNLLTNAVKFTKEGYVHLKINFDTIDDEHILLKVYVKDTGMGIKKEDFSKLFNSFQQVDSKRNRNVEGTGLGLAISKQLLNLMGGNISLKSEYGKGSTFFFKLPQKVLDKKPAISKPDRNIKTAVFVNNYHIKLQLEKDLNKLGIEYIDIKDYHAIKESDFEYVFVEEDLFTKELESFASEDKNRKYLVITDYYNRKQCDLNNVTILPQPAYILNIIIALGFENPMSEGFSDNKVNNFIAPNAKILIVDDNSVNLKVAEGLLAPFRLQIDTAISAKAAVDLIGKKQYDIIFMDHMMPDIDGVEATHIIRRLFTNYINTPIIALTANAISGVREMFIREGMNDFIAKPIDVKVMAKKLKKWLPQEKIVRVTDNINYAEVDTSEKENLEVADLDTAFSLTLLETTDLFWAVLKEFYSVIDKKADIIQKYKEAALWKDYTVEVHALKSSAKQIGAIELSKQAELLENAGNDGDIDYILKNSDAMIEKYLSYKDTLSEYFPEETKEESNFITTEIAKELLVELRDAIDSFDSLILDEVVSKMEKYDVPDEFSIWKDYIKSLRTAVDKDDIDDCDEILNSWDKTL